MRSLQAKVVILFSILILAAVLSIGISLYTSSTKLITQSIGHQALAVLNHALKSIDPAVFGAITPEKGQTGDYDKLRQRLNEIRETNGLKYLYTMRRTEGAGQPEYRYVVDGMPAGSGEASALGTVEEEGTEAFAQVYATGASVVGDLSVSEEYGATLSAYVPIKDAGGAVIGLIGADFDAGDIQALMDRNKSRSLLIFGCIMLVSLLLVFATTRWLVRPLRLLTGQMGKVRGGDLTVRMETHRTDEIGQLTLSVGQTVADLRQLIHLIQVSADRLKSAAEALAGNSAKAEQSSGLISRTMQEAAAGADEQLRQSVAASGDMEEMAEEVGRIALSAGQVLEAARATVEIAGNGNVTMRRMERQMDSIGTTSSQLQASVARLNEHSEQIGAIAGAIASIAGQTNILSLNAGIEAARAGEMGRGFAVVAAEIRKLAEQASGSSTEIAALIDAVRQEIERASEAIEANHQEVQSGQRVAGEAGQTFASIMTEMERVGGRFEQVTGRAEHISGVARQVTSTVGEVTDITKRAAGHFAEVSGASGEQLRQIKEMAAAASSLQQMAGELYGFVIRFKV